jgi:hypothetical protein
MLTRMVESSSGAPTTTIEAVRQELSHFQGKQSDAAVKLRCAAVDVYLAGGLKSGDDPWLRKILASNVEKLDKAVRNSRLNNPDTNESENHPRVASVAMTLASDFTDGPRVLVDET